MSDNECDIDCPRCGAPATLFGPPINDIVCSLAADLSNEGCNYAAGLLDENDWLKREADAADERAERYKAVIERIRSASGMSIGSLLRHLEADDET